MQGTNLPARRHPRRYCKEYRS